MKGLHTIARQFELKSPVSQIRPFGAGNINRTFLLTTTATPAEKIILQEINPDIFSNPRQIMDNLAVVIHHMSIEMGRESISDLQWRLPRIIKSRNRQDCYIAPNGNCWRAIHYIDKTVSFERVDSPEQAEKAGIALGRFHRLTANLDPGLLHDTLPGFHQTPGYVKRFDRIRQKRKGQISESPEYDRYCLDSISSQKEKAAILEKAKEDGKLQIRTIHGDPKISNILFSKESGAPVSLIDLDTVKPGLIQYDIGDFFRSICNPAGEETPDPETARFDIRRFEAGLKGYLSEMGSLLTEADTNYTFDAIRLLTFELGIRFYTDFLEGNVYFTVKHETHNLFRAATQFKLAESITDQKDEICTVIERRTI